jgi:tetratricopeptide (TPR) repeat protein
LTLVFNLRHSCRRAARTSLALAAACALLPAAGCATGWTSKRAGGGPPPGPVDGMVMRAGHVEPDAVPAAGTAAAEFESARKLYQDGEYARAESVFHKIARDKEASLVLTEEALYFEADCLRLQGHYPRAAELYQAHVEAYQAGRYTSKARQRMFEIANYWLDDTRKYMEAVKERRAGKRWFVMPVSFVNFDRTRPLLDCKGHALRLMEKVYLTDPTGPLAEEALFFLGTIKFFEEDYRVADHFYTELIRHHPNGKRAPEAVELSIICKQMATGGSEYDTRLVSEARELVDRARAAYPELARKENFLLDQLHSINQQQADKDWKIAEF